MWAALRCSSRSDSAPSCRFLFADPRVATAAAAAFAVSEITDTAIYARLQSCGRLVAVGVSNLAGAAVDSILFLQLAFGGPALFPGQAIGKAWATATALAVLGALGRTRRRNATR